MGSSDGFTNLEPKNHESFSTEINVITFAKFRDSGFLINKKYSNLINLVFLLLL